MRIFFTGGGTAGSVTPLLATAEHLSKRQLYFVGTYHGVERQLVTRLHYLPLLAGKFRRYWSWHQLLDPVLIVLAFLQALYYVNRYRPEAVVSAGSFVSVPLVWAAWSCNVPVVIHQQDLTVGLATQLMRPFAQVVTKAFPDIPLPQAEWIGNPVRDLTPTTNTFTIDPQYPTILIFGGGTGAQAINQLMDSSWCDFATVIHGTGVGKSGPAIRHPRYQPRQLFGEDMKEAFTKADVVICRAGLGTISELSTLGKAAIVIPIPRSHQIKNAAWLTQHHAALVLQQEQLTPTILRNAVQQLLSHPSERRDLEQSIARLNKPRAAQVFAQRILALAV